MVDLVKLRQKEKEKKEAARAEKTSSGDEGALAPGKPPAKRARKKKSPAAPPDFDTPSAEISNDVVVETVLDKAAPMVEPVVELVVEPAPIEIESEEPAPAVQAKDTVAQKPKDARPASVESTSSGSETLEPPVVMAASPEPSSNPAMEEKPPKRDRLALFKLAAGKRRTWTAAPTHGKASEEDEVETGELELLRFRLSGEEYAVDIENIVEIVPPRSTTRVPNADDTVVGIMSLRGTIVTVFDLCHKLGHPKREKKPGDDPRMIVVERAGETAGFLVDRVSRVVKLDPEQLENHPVVSAAEQSDWVGGVFQSSDGLVILLDLEKILAS